MKPAPTSVHPPSFLAWGTTRRWLASPAFGLLLGACTAAPEPASLAAIQQEHRSARMRECLAQWTRYENTCRRQLVMWQGSMMPNFCREYADSKVSSAYLPVPRDRCR